MKAGDLGFEPNSGALGLQRHCVVFLKNSRFLSISASLLHYNHMAIELPILHPICTHRKLHKILKIGVTSTSIKALHGLKASSLTRHFGVLWLELDSEEISAQPARNQRGRAAA